jgi:hypothetical protein
VSAASAAIGCTRPSRKSRALLVPPPVWPVNPAVTALLLLPSLFDVDYLTAERAEIYVGRSRHWAVAWLWFLS